MTVDFESYYAVSNIAVAITGFIGIIAALQHSDHRFPSLVLSTVLATSIGAMLFAYLPILLWKPLGPALSWRVSCGLFGLYHLALILNHQVRQLQFRANTPVQMVVVFVSVFPVVALKLAVGMGFLLSFAYEVFLLGLLWCVFIPAYLLAMVLLENR